MSDEERREERAIVALEGIADALMCIARALNSSGGSQLSGISLAEAVIIASGKQNEVG